MKAIETTVSQPMEQAEAALRKALSEEGFGVLSEIDLSGTLAAKLGVERPPLRILGACNPGLAHRALEADPSVSLLLPCNVVLEEVPAGTRIAAADPTDLLGGSGVDDIAEEAASRLRRVLDRVAEGSTS